MACGKHCDICPMLHSVRNIFFKQIYAKHVWSDSSQVGKEGKGENIILLRTSRLPIGAFLKVGRETVVSTVSLKLVLK